MSNIVPVTGLTPEVLADAFPPIDPENPPDVGVVMGSDSDLGYMAWAVDTLGELGIPNEVGVTSAHRTPELMVRYGHIAVSRGLKVIIAGAGGSAHLPGDMASLTRLPVIGVPIEGDPLDPLLPALGSMLRMPPEGGPVLTASGMRKSVAINAALSAARILAINNPELAERVEARMAKNAAASMAKNTRIFEIGMAEYMTEKGIERKEK